MMNLLFKRNTLRYYILSTINRIIYRTHYPDLVGYESLIQGIIQNKILSIPGDFIEIGVFLGGGTRKLSEFLTWMNCAKKIYCVDIFDPDFDLTQNTAGRTMAEIYQTKLKTYSNVTQWDIFSKVTGNCKNIKVLKQDSKKAVLPNARFCFGFIDGNHAPDYVENDFYLIWKKLSSGGMLAFHDYRGDLPNTTAKIDELINRHKKEISLMQFNKKRFILCIIKK